MLQSLKGKKMCQTKAQGGKRCSAHMAGSMATVSLTSRIAAVQEKIVRKVFGELKKEGKGLENPKQEEVVSYAETGKFLTRYNPDIPERQKNTIMKQFDKAKEEKPTGAVFHAWNHTLPEVLRRTRKTMAATGLAGALMFSSACGGSAGINNETTPAPEPTTTISASASPTASPSPTEDANSNIIDNVPVKEGTVSDGIGEYRQTTIGDDEAAMKYDPSKATEFAKSNFTPEELEAVQKQSVRFLAEEGLDSTANGSGQAGFDAWWKKNENLVHPSQKDVIYNAETTSPEKAGIVLRSTWREGKYGFDYSEQTRVKNRNITVTGIDGGNAPDGQPYVTVKANVAFQSPILVEGRQANESVTGTTSYTYLKDSDGKFKIAGYNVMYNAVEAPR